MIVGRPRRNGLPAAGELVEDATTVRAAYQALEDDDPRKAAPYLDPSVRLVHPAVVRLPFDGVLTGVPSLLPAGFRRDENGDGPRVFGDTFLEMGDGVLVVGRFAEGEGPDRTETPFLHECSVRSARIFRIREYPAET